jgi:hypothetical protein
VDFLIVGKSSGGYEFVFVELEHPYKNIFIDGGDFGQAFRNGLNQVEDWKYWLDESFSSFAETFIKYKSKTEQLPPEFFRRDSTRYHYVVIAGRRKDFEKNQEKTYKKQRDYQQKGIQLLHYDNVYDFAKSTIGNATY